MTGTTQAVRADGLVALHPRVLAPVLEDLGIELDRVHSIGEPNAKTPARESHLLVGAPAGKSAADFAPAILAEADAHASADGILFLALAGGRSDEELADLRNRLWPAWHVGAIFRTSNEQVTRTTLEGKRDLRRGTGFVGQVLVARRRAVVLAPDATVAKFDRNARSWNGEPGRPGYRHFRWMRRFVAELAGPGSARRILDFGCGAGWVGIEAALSSRRAGGDPMLCAFDPSPEMVSIAGENARAQQLSRFEARTGFGESPPYPGPGEERFDLVLSSGVISFAADTEAWLDGLVSALAPGGTLVIGDIHRESRGMRKRRERRPLLPVREMNAHVREDVRARLESRCLVFETWCGYQLSDPLPQLLHYSQRRLGGALDGMLLAWNARASRRDLEQGSREQDRFDSWVMRMRAPR